jgi:arginine/lysine/ornithine decarboxylase
MVSLDGARRQLALHGEQLLHETLQALRAARKNLETIEGVSLVDSALAGRPGVAGRDPLRLVVDVRGTGRTGYEVAEALRQAYDVHPELATQATVVFIVGLGESAATLERLAGDIEETIGRIRRPGTTTEVAEPASSFHNEMVILPRDAFLGEADLVSVERAIGRVSCESIAGYPPGIPSLLPGERISGETVDYLRALIASGARLHGASDPNFQKINVLREG